MLLSLLLLSVGEVMGERCVNRFQFLCNNKRMKERKKERKERTRVVRAEDSQLLEWNAVTIIRKESVNL
jgi:hypothetical protein